MMKPILNWMMAYGLMGLVAQGSAGDAVSIQPVDMPVRMVLPQRVMKVRWDAGRLIPTSDWIGYGDFTPAGPCGANERVVFDHFGSEGLFYRGAQYHNPYWANDIKSLVGAQYNGATASSLAHAWFWNPNRTSTPSGAQRCIILILTVEQFDSECQDVHENVASFLDGVILDYGVLAAGGYTSPVCLSAIGGIDLPATPADDGAPGTVLLGGWIVIYAQAFNPHTGTITRASGAQPILGYIENIGRSTPTQWDDDNPPDGDHTPPDECYQYRVHGDSVLGGALTLWVVCEPSAGDVDGNGCVDDADLLAVLFAFGGSGGAEDVNCDGVVDDADLLIVLFNFGSGC
jgi:hypothetical protein